MASSRCFSFVLLFRSVIHFELVFVMGVRSVSRFIYFASGCPVVEKTIFAPLCVFAPSSNIIDCTYRVSFWILYSVTLTYLLFFFSPIPHCLYTRSWSQVVEILHHCSSPSILCSLFWFFCLSIQILESVCHCPQNNLGFDWELHWSHRSSWKEQTSWQYWIFLPMNVE